MAHGMDDKAVGVVEALTNLKHVRCNGHESGAVCPACGRPLEIISMSLAANIGGVTLRHYYGQCGHCKTSCEVVQFGSDGAWLTHKMRTFKVGDWHSCFVEVVPLPQSTEQPPILKTHNPNTAPVVGQGKYDLSENNPVLKIGPGGDFTNEITEEQLDGLMRKCTELLGAFGNILNFCVDLKKKFRTANGHK